jgi:hypothetical protein
MHEDRKEMWWKAEKGMVFDLVLQHVQEVEQRQSDMFDRFVKLSYLYDPNSPFTGGDMPRRGPDSFVSENVIARNIDTAYAAIASTAVRARFHTDDGDWSDQRRARHLSWYGEALGKMLEFEKKGRMAFKGCEIKGTGLVKFWIEPEQEDANDRIRCERVIIDNIIVDEAECRGGQGPLQLHERVLIDREVLARRYPEHRAEIMEAQRGGIGMEGGNSNLWADYREISENQVVYVESFYRGQRHTCCIDGFDLLDEPWEHDWFPYSTVRWSERERGWYGIGLAERIIGQQRVINKSNWQEDMLIDKFGHPTTYVGQADSKMAVGTRSKIGDIVVYKDRVPVTVIPQAVPPEVQNRRAYAIASASDESGVSQEQSAGALPKGLETGAAVREVRETRKGRFHQQDIGYEDFRLNMVWMGLQFAKMLAEKAPTIIRRSRLGPRKFKWSDVDMQEVKVQMSAASTLPRETAGRSQMFLEAAQAGVISQEEARVVFDPHSPLDMERPISLYTSTLKAIEADIELILDGEVVMPDPNYNLAMAKWRAQMSFNRAQSNGAPEDILEGLRTYARQAAGFLARLEAPQMSAMGGPPVQLDPMQAMPVGSEPVPQSTPQAALAPEAMNLAPK